MRIRTLALWLLLLGCLLPALTLTIVRLAEPGSGVAVRAISFTSFGLPAWAVVFALGLGKVLFPGERSWRPWAVLGLVAAVGVGLHGWWVSPLYVGRTPAPAEDARSFTVMTANLLKGQADSIGVVEKAAVASVDVLVLQEVTPAALRQMERAGLSDAFPYRAGQPADGVEGTMVLSATRLGEATRLDTRFDSWAVTIFRPEGELRLLAVHPQPPMQAAQGWWRDHEQVRLAATEDVDIIAGDFNATPDHRPMRSLRGAGFRSAVEVANSGWQPTWPADGATDWLGRWIPRAVEIDHVLVGPDLTALDTHRLDIPGTDHNAVVAELAPR